MSEPELPCCGYADTGAVMWNPANRVVQCHNCGAVYSPARADLVARLVAAEAASKMAYREGWNAALDSSGASDGYLPERPCDYCGGDLDDPDHFRNPSHIAATTRE